MERLNPQTPEIGDAGLNTEELVKITRLRHGVAVLDLFTKEEGVEDHRKNFLDRTLPGTESRAKILDGPSYQGNEAKLTNAINKARNRYAIYNIRRQSMLELAGFLNIPASLEGDRIVTTSPQDMKTLGLVHGKWRSSFGTRNRQQERLMHRNFLETKVRKIIDEPENDTLIIEDGPSVNLEDRAVLLTHAVNAMARRSMLSGLGVAILDDNYSDPVYERYQEDTYRVDRASVKKVDRLLVAAKNDFWLASGYAALRGSGLMSEFLLRRRAQKMWKEFAGQFEHSPQQKKRIDLRKSLRPYIPTDRLDDTPIDTI